MAEKKEREKLLEKNVANGRELRAKLRAAQKEGGPLTRSKLK